MKARHAFSRITQVQTRDFSARKIENLRIRRVQLGVAVRPVGEQREIKLVGNVGEVMNLDVADILLDVIA